MYPLLKHQIIFEHLWTLIRKLLTQIYQIQITILYQIYIEDIEGINNNFTIIEMNDIIYHVILTDLSNYQKYLDGIIKKVTKGATELI